MKINIGTTNKGKLREIASILTPLGYEMNQVVSEVKEIGKTIKENAILKGVEYSKKYPNVIMVSEDSGLTIPSLNGLPGVHSAIFSELELDGLSIVSVPDEKFNTDKTENDKRNNKRLLSLIKSIKEENREAYLEVCYTVSLNGKILFESYGLANGIVTDELKGINGFGYDPLFIGNDSYGKTYAELDNARKNLRSHRKIALKKVYDFLSKYEIL